MACHKKGVYALILLLSAGMSYAAPPTAAQIDTARNKALAWLLTHQSGEGSWKNQLGAEIITTSSILEALEKTGVKGPAYSRGTGWLSNAKTASTDSLPRKAISMYKAGMDTASLMTSLIAMRGGSRSWGAYARYGGTFPGTSLAMEAIQNHRDRLCGYRLRTGIYRPPGRTPMAAGPITRLRFRPRRAKSFPPRTTSSLATATRPITPYRPTSPTASMQPLGINANTLGSAINAGATNNDRDWGQTMVFIDLPNPLATGTATIELLQGTTAVAPPIIVTIVAGVGSANTFAGSSPLPTGTTTENMLGSLERSTSYVVTFGGSTVIPYAIQLDLNRTANIGRPWVANPRGDLKNLAWNDNGSKITVLMTPANGLTPPAMSYFKFYVSGGTRAWHTPPTASRPTISTAMRSAALPRSLRRSTESKTRQSNK
ncbi:MAG: hypothetical protein ACOY4D_07385 [Pseudomonadota bacterium]